jgi:acyl dehydratase
VVRAHNAATASENLIHDDRTAREYGFAGGLVPGVTVYAYMTYPVVQALGRDWLEHGSAQVRFLEPFYEGGQVTVRTSTSEREGAAAALTVEALDENGRVCATGSAWLPAERVAAPGLDEFPEAPLSGERPRVSPKVLAAMPVMGTVRDRFTAARGLSYLEEVQDDLALYRGAAAVAHPGALLGYANRIFAENVRLDPWIHVSSALTHFSTVADGEDVSVRGRVTNLFERKGHRFVDLDVLVVAGSARPVMRVLHTAIYAVRRVGVQPPD